MLDDFRLTVFKAVVKERSFTRAANVLGVSQPAVSQNVAELEKTLGVRLFERQRGETQLTVAGETFLTYTEKFEALSDKKDYFGFIRDCWREGISADLIEICFLTNRKDFDTYQKNKEEIAKGLARSIVEAYGKTFKESKSSVPKPQKSIGSGRLNKNRVDVKR